MARVRRECREASLPSIHFRKPPDFFLEDCGWSKKPFVYHSRDILKENIRMTKTLQPRRNSIREVPPFSLQSRQSNTTTMELPKRARSIEPQHQDESSKFRELYSGGDLPVKIHHNGATGDRPTALKWTKDPQKMNPETIAFLLAKFALGLPLLDQPFRFVAECGLLELMAAVKHPETVLRALPQLVRAIRASLYSFDVEKRKFTMKLLSRITRFGSCGPALLPFYRQLLPPLRKVGHVGVKSDVIYGRGRQIDELIDLTLNDLERTGGPNAFINIKYIIPTYESCMGRM